MEKLFILLTTISFAYLEKPNYIRINRNEVLKFKLTSSDSLFYAYLPYEEDFEIDEDKYIQINHFLRLNKKIGFKHRFIESGTDFPDESSFNKSSNGTDREHGYEYQTLEPFENIKLKEYYKLENDYNISIFVFYIEEQFLDSFDPNETFSISRLRYNPYRVDKVNYIINEELEKDDLKFYIFNSDYKIRDNIIFFINSPISSLYEYYEGIYYHIISNTHLFHIEDITEAIIIFAYNNNNYKQKIILEYYDNYHSDGCFNYIDLTTSNKYLKEGKKKNFFYASIEQPGLYKINTIQFSDMYLFNDNINEIKNLTDLRKINHYKYISQGYYYFSDNYFIIMLNSNSYMLLSLSVEKIEMNEKLKEINIQTFEYFKISEGNTLKFNLNNTNQSIVLKLLSDNDGNLDINDKNYSYHKNEVKVINIENEQLKIKSLDNNFTFAIKLKIPEELIDYPEVGKPYILPNNTNYKFLIYKVNNSINLSSLYFEINGTNNLRFCYELTSEKNENEIANLNIIGGKSIFKFYNLQLYNNIPINQSLYLFFFFENINSDNIVLTTKYYKYVPSNIFNLIQDESYNYFYEENKREVFFIIPCTGEITIIRFRHSESLYITGDKPFSFSARGDFSDYVYFYSLGVSQPDAFIYHYGLEINETEYTYYGEITTKPIQPDFIYEILNKTHIRLFIEKLFSNAPKIRYILVITSYENENLLEPICQFFNSFYLNEPPVLDNLEIYHFEEEFKYDSNLTKYKYYLDLPLPTKVDLNKKNQKFMGRLMGITEPRNFIRFYYSYYKINCYETCLTCNDIGTEDNHNCESCDSQSKYNYLSGKNCVEKCPTGEKTTSDPEGYKCVKDENFNTYIIIGVIGGALIITIIVIIVYIMLKKKKNSQKEQINKMNEMKALLNDKNN